MGISLSGCARAVPKRSVELWAEKASRRRGGDGGDRLRPCRAESRAWGPAADGGRFHPRPPGGLRPGRALQARRVSHFPRYRTWPPPTLPRPPAHPPAEETSPSDTTTPAPPPGDPQPVVSPTVSPVVADSPAPDPPPAASDPGAGDGTVTSPPPADPATRLRPPPRPQHIGPRRRSRAPLRSPRRRSRLRRNRPPPPPPASPRQPRARRQRASRRNIDRRSRRYSIPYPVIRPLPIPRHPMVRESNL